MIDAVGQRIGLRVHSALISIAWIGWEILMVGNITLIVKGWTNLDPQVLQRRAPLIGVQVIVGILMIVAEFFELTHK